MSFVVTSPAPEQAEAPITCGAFWPDIDPAKIREAYRIDNTTTTARLREALVEAAASVIDELSAWQTFQIAAGFATLADVPAAEIDGESIRVARFRRAVACLAKASLIERTADYDTTPAGQRKSETLTTTVDDLRRDARWAMSDVLGTGRSVIELI